MRVCVSEERGCKLVVSVRGGYASESVVSVRGGCVSEGGVCNGACVNSVTDRG